MTMPARYAEKADQVRTCLLPGVFFVSPRRQGRNSIAPPVGRPESACCTLYQARYPNADADGDTYAVTAAASHSRASTCSEPHFRRAQRCRSRRLGPPDNRPPCYYSSSRMPRGA